MNMETFEEQPQMNSGDTVAQARETARQATLKTLSSIESTVAEARSARASTAGTLRELARHGQRSCRAFVRLNEAVLGRFKCIIVGSAREPLQAGKHSLRGRSAVLAGAASGVFAAVAEHLAPPSVEGSEQPRADRGD